MTFIKDGFYSTIIEGRKNGQLINIMASNLKPRGYAKSLPFLNLDFCDSKR